MVRHMPDGKNGVGEMVVLGGLMTGHQLCGCHGVIGSEHSRGKVPCDWLSCKVEVTEHFIGTPSPEELDKTEP